MSNRSITVAGDGYEYDVTEEVARVLTERGIADRDEHNRHRWLVNDNYALSDIESVDTEVSQRAPRYRVGNRDVAWTYCSVCGKRMMWSVETFYDIETGEPIDESVWRCVSVSHDLIKPGYGPAE